MLVLGLGLEAKFDGLGFERSGLVNITEKY